MLHLGCVQVIAGIRPYIEEQQTSQRSNSQRMEALQTEVNRLTKQAQDAENRYILSSFSLFVIKSLCCPLQW